MNYCNTNNLYSRLTVCAEIQSLLLGTEFKALAAKARGEGAPFCDRLEGQLKNIAGGYKKAFCVLQEIY